MLRLQLTDGRSQREWLLDAYQLRAKGPTLIQEGSQGQQIARHTENFWLVEGERLTRMDLDGPLSVHFENDKGEVQERIGLFSHLYLLNNYLFSGGYLLACYSHRDHGWQSFSTGKTGPVIVMRRAARFELHPEVRHQMIAEAAYFHAEHRGFVPGRELDDWLDAEHTIDRQVRQNASVHPRRDQPPLLYVAPTLSSRSHT